MFLRELQDDDGTVSGTAIDSNLTAVLPHDSLHDHHSETVPGFGKAERRNSTPIGAMVWDEG